MEAYLCQKDSYGRTTSTAGHHPSEERKRKVARTSCVFRERECSPERTDGRCFGASGRTAAKGIRQKVWRKPSRRNDAQNPPSSSLRTPESYRRAPSKEEEITDTKHFPIESCSVCDTPLEHTRIVVRYQEDVLTPEEWHKLLKITEKHRIATGYCPHCKQRVSVVPVSQHLVPLARTLSNWCHISMSSSE